MNEQVLTQYVQELTAQRTQLEYTVFSLRAQIKDLEEKLAKHDTVKEGSDTTASGS